MKKYEKANRRTYAAALICTFLSSVFAVALQFFKGAVLDYALAGQLGQTIRYAFLLILFIGLEVGGYYLSMRFSDRYVAACFSALRCDIFDSILGRDFVDYKTCPQGEYLAGFTAKAETIRDRRFRMKPYLWEILFKIILVSAALFRLDWRVAIITIVLLSTPLYVPKLIEDRLQSAQTAYLKSMEDNLTKVTDWLAGFEIIKNFSVEEKIRSRFRQSNDNAMDKLRADQHLGAVSQLITTLMSYLSYYIVLVVSGWLVLRGVFSAGDFFIAIGMIDQLSWPLISLANIIRQLIAVEPQCAQMERFLAEGQGRGQGGAVTQLRSQIRFRNVCFGYDERRRILDGFDLTIGKGSRCLLKGASGSGKTTAVNLLLRYHDVTAGTIEIDGVPIERFADTYGLITVVRQEATLFRDSLRSNLTMYRDMPDERLSEVLRGVGLERLANREALDELVAEGGANFSGGEKKRLCLARALLRDTDVLILDEPLANLDNATAERIEELLLSIRDRTLIVVSHQFTPSKLCRFDQVVEM